ncbi:hypothetical protein GCM10022206_50240 [Streptomyces chiangmaiensis]
MQHVWCKQSHSDELVEGPTRSDRRLWLHVAHIFALPGQEFASPPHPGAEHVLGSAAVQAHVQRTREVCACPSARGQGCGIKAVSASDQEAEFVTVDRVRPCNVTDPGVMGVREFQNRCGKVRDMYGATEIVGEQDSAVLPSALRDGRTAVDQWARARLVVTGADRQWPARRQ